MAAPASSPPSTPPPERWERAQGPALLAVLAVLAVAGLSPAYVPTHDGPQHIWAVHVAQHLDDAGRGWSDWLDPGSPITSHGYAAVFGPLDRLLPWPVAHRITITILAWLFAVGAFAWARSLDPRRGWLGISLSGLAFGWTFYMGFLDFHAATGAAFAGLGWAFARPRDSPRDTVLLALGLLVVAWLHLVAAFLAGVLLASLIWFRAQASERGAALLRIAVLATPGALLTGLLLSSGWDQLQLWNAHGPGGSGWAPAPWWCAGACFAGGPWWRAWPVPLGAIAALGLAVARRGSEARAEERALWFAGGALLLAGLLLPLDLPAWDFFSPRFLPFGLAALWLSLPIERFPLPRAAAVACSSFALASGAWSLTHHQDLQRSGAAFWAGVDQPLERRGMRHPIVLDPRPDGQHAHSGPIPFALPWVNLGQLYAAEQGGLTPFGFALNPSLHHVLVRDDAAARLPALVDRRYVGDLTLTERREDPGFRRALLTHLASQSIGFEDVVFAGRPEEADWLVALGFEEDWRQDGVSVARFRGCPVEIRLSPEASRAERLGVGWAPSGHAGQAYAVAAGIPFPDGSRSLPLRQGCGALWIDLDGGRVACEGADPAGRLHLPADRAPRSVVCRLPDEAWPQAAAPAFSPGS